MTAHITDYIDARDRLFALVLESVDDGIPSAIAARPYMRWQGVPNPGGEEPPRDAIWLHTSIRMFNAGQETLADFGKEKRWGRAGALTVQYFSPLLDPSSLRINEQLAILAQRKFQSAGSQCGFLFRNMLIRPIGPDDAWFNINFYAEFEYTEFN